MERTIKPRRKKKGLFLLLAALLGLGGVSIAAGTAIAPIEQEVNALTTTENTQTIEPSDIGNITKNEDIKVGNVIFRFTNAVYNTQTRIFANSTMTISLADSNSDPISKIEMTFSASGTSEYGSAKLSIDSTTPDSTKDGYTYSGTIGTWSANDGDPVTSLTFKATAQARVTKFVITYEPSTTVTLDKTTLSGKGGDYLELKASSEGFSTTPTYTWTSDDENVAIVSGSTSDNSIGDVLLNNVTDDSAATITCKATDGTNTSSATCTVTVYAPTISLDKGSISGFPNDTATIKATTSYIPDGDEVIYVWDSDNETCALVAEDETDTTGATANVTLLASGEATITCTVMYGDDMNDISATCSVAVNSAPETITITGNTSTEVDTTATLSATIAPSDADQSVTWKSSDTNVATIDSTGVVTGIAEGTTTITATSTALPSLSKSIEFTVTAKPNYFYRLVTNADDIQDGDRVIIGSYILENWYAVQNKVYSNIYTAAAEATRSDNLLSSSSGTSWHVSKNDAGQLTFYDSNIGTSTRYLSSYQSGSTYRAYPVESLGEGCYWTLSVDENGIATLESDLGVLIRGYGRSSTIDFGGYSTTTTSGNDIYLFKGETPATLESVSITADKTEIFVGGVAKLTETTLPETDLATIQWTSSNPACATVADDGTVTGVAAGTSTIKVTATGANSVNDEITITVRADDVDTLTYTGSLTNPQYAGEAFDPTGLTFTVTRLSGASQTVNTSDLTFNPETLTTETTQVVATHTDSGKTCTIAITIAETPIYELVTSASDLVLGDRYAILYNNGTSSYAMSATQGDNNRDAISVSVSSDSFTTKTGDDIGSFILSAGKKAGTYSFYDSGSSSGYLYAASSKNNYLRTESPLSNDSSWSISISEGVASVIAQGTNSRNTLQYNSSSTLFSCYSSASQKGISIFHATNIDNDGVNAWAASFIEESGKVCSYTKDLDNPDDLMGSLSISNLSTPAQDALKYATSDNATGVLAQALERYDTIVNKYTNCTDILGRRSNSGSTSLYHGMFGSEEASSYVIVLSIAGGALLAGGAFFAFKRKKEKAEEE